MAASLRAARLGNYPALRSCLARGRTRGRPLLFEPIKLGDVVVPNRIFLSPMCMYSAQNGVPNNWHLVHLGARAAGGCGLVMAEATAVVPEGRISPNDTGIWNDQQEAAWRPIADFIRSQGSVAAIQLAHAGRKACTAAPFVEGGRPLWTPREMSETDIQAVVDAFAEGATRAVRAGFQVVEIHMAHGYLLHQFLSPVANRRTDRWGGSLENRMRLPLAVAAAVRQALPAGAPLLVRISATDWADLLDGPSWDVGQSCALVRALREVAGVDLVDVSSGGMLPRGVPGVGPGYQVPFAERIRKDTGVPTGAVGLITQARQAEQILAEGRADAVFLAREMLRDPHWPLRAAAELGSADVRYPPQYERGKF
ncbi:hypothetical protein GPECTOR_3g168 [Gonium pectorale]|uniref:NADH:flavin oxidoreductase/NADH oxidase N-terminal domain-containing protein n=1 Tax=Gonium pectorale TaxID=33097 RepID=A0A150GYZ4_GONPE|nr:hypothetical protein GPECTOR_3g168 [Gonium pectorale]|eukprot:KXZ55004.1 hypothetical protein GPECTOR_3g168 [Gonium pectorale]